MTVGQSETEFLQETVYPWAAPTREPHAILVTTHQGSEDMILLREKQPEDIGAIRYLSTPAFGST